MDLQRRPSAGLPPSAVKRRFFKPDRAMPSMRPTEMGESSSLSRKGLDVEVSFSDNGRGLDPQEIKTIFDPGFRVGHGRVSTGNWSMFSSRQIVREHGGEIQIESERGKGTCVRVVLPVSRHGSAYTAFRKRPQMVRYHSTPVAQKSASRYY